MKNKGDLVLGAHEFSGWLPQEPQKGPPLPAFLKIYWPWYREAPPETPDQYAKRVLSQAGIGGVLDLDSYRQIQDAIPGWEGQSQYALGAPDGVPAILMAGEGNHLTLQLSEYPIMVSRLKMYLVNLYPYDLTANFLVEVSSDDVSWVLVANPTSTLYVGSQVWNRPVNQAISMIRFSSMYPAYTGLHEGIDAVEIVP